VANNVHLSARKLSKSRKLKSRSLAKLVTVWGAIDCAVCIGQCPVSRLFSWPKRSLSGNCWDATTIIHRTVRCASHMSGQRSAAQSTPATSAHPKVTRSHRTIRCGTKLSGVSSDQRNATVGSVDTGKESVIVQCSMCTGPSYAPTDTRQPGPSK
jgi:heterodisulfide reductase subunit C